jgi:N,N'-diacetyllegionaminate synthase
MKIMQTIIIAEAGVNHNGSLNIAKQLVEVAANAGADYVKFQTFIAKNLVSSKAVKAEYQKNNLKNDSNDFQFEMLKKLELSFDDHLEILTHCKKFNIKFLSTAFDLESVKILNSIGLDLWKIPSGEITNLPYLELLGGFKKKVVISTGMSTLKEIGEALNVLIESGTLKDDITILHCNTDYPTNMEDVNLLAMIHIKNNFNVKVGYSDHTLGIEVPIAAVALGATLIEKHFTLDRELDGPDHKASLEPNELYEMVKAVRNIEKALGDGMKVPSRSEIKNLTIARKSIHLKKDMKIGQEITIEDVIMKRPGDGISPMLLKEIVGKKIIKELKADHKLDTSDFK